MKMETEIPKGASLRGTIFDIQRGSFHDGPGLRTTVFLKGCALNCLWCHNPESRSRKPQLSFRIDRCTGCQNCVSVCPNGCHDFSEGNHIIRFQDCASCGKCVEICPSDALRLFGRETDTEEVMKEVVRDKIYYKTSDGGMTLSGGEPTAQIEFTLSLLMRAKSEGIHTCIETCGISRQEHYARLLPWVDLFLFDYKATGEDQHKKLTGVSNRLILANLSYLHAAGATIILRCPMIPGINDTEEHLGAIAEMGKRLPNLRGIELLPYHSAGSDKYERIGQHKPDLVTHPPTATETQRWRNALSRLGCDNVYFK